MHCTVLLFGRLAETLHRGQLSLELPPQATVADAVAALAREHDAIAALRDSIAVAVDERYVRRTTPLRDGQTIAIIPPVSGG